MSFSNVGMVWSPVTFAEYLSGKKPPAWVKSVTVHHTAAPSLAQRPSGFTAQHIKNIQSFYQLKYRWTKGPHFFTDEDQIWGMTPPTVQGIHAKSFNSSSIGIEVLGNYDVESPTSGRGEECWQVAASTVRILLDWVGVSPSTKTILFHRDDPKTTKTCPGKLVAKDPFIDMVKAHAVKRGGIPLVETVLSAPELVPVAAYVSTKKNLTFAVAAKNLKKQGNQFLLFGYWLEGAFYDSLKKTTVAPQDEIDEILEALCK
jgi:hypothetical protein